MVKRSLNGLLQNVRKMAAVQTYRALSDGKLLDCFVAGRDEAAFTVLIERHGPMVLGVCRRALANCHDAEDACQAVFFVLARKASSVRRQASLASWLHGVAGRVCLSLKRDLARRRNHEHRAKAPAPADPASEVTWREVQAILDTELERLPERYRAPFILCYLECLPREEAARRLGLSPGSLHGRLERARDLLRERLTKRGLTLAGVISAAAVGEGVGQAALAPAFVVSSARAAMLLTSGRSLADSVISTHVLALTQEVVKTMFLTKLRFGMAAVLCAGLFLALIGGSFTSMGIAQEAKSKPLVELANNPTGKAESDADFIRRVSKDLRGTDPTPTEIHFFVTSTDAGRRQKLIDLFIQERQARKEAQRATDGSHNTIELSGKKGGDFEVISLQHARAAEVAKILEQLFNGPSNKLERVRVVADPATNSILIRAAPEDVSTVRRMLELSLDAKSERPEATHRNEKLTADTLGVIKARTIINLPDDSGTKADHHGEVLKVQVAELSVSVLVKADKEIVYLTTGDDKKGDMTYRITDKTLVLRGDSTVRMKFAQMQNGDRVSIELDKPKAVVKQIRVHRRGWLVSLPLADKQIVINSRTFNIAVQIQPGQREQLKRLTLRHSTDKGASWTNVETRLPEEVQEGFIFRAASDGVYWFSISIEDKEGRFMPDPHGSEPFPVHLKVQVDTSKK
jgi:RNA polymerase sigma factor (sigma-70 family)